MTSPANHHASVLSIRGCLKVCSVQGLCTDVCVPLQHKVRTGGTSQSLDSPSDSPHTCREANQSAEVGSASGSYVSSSSHRQGHAWAHAEQQGQHGRLNGQRAAPGPRPRAAVASQGNGNAKDSSAALAAASAAAAAALRGPGRGAGHAGMLSCSHLKAQTSRHVV